MSKCATDTLFLKVCVPPSHAVKHGKLMEHLAINVARGRWVSHKYTHASGWVDPLWLLQSKEDGRRV